MTISGSIDWGGIAFGATLPTGMCWLIGEDSNHYAVASASNPWTIGCAETNTIPITIDQTQWQADLASLAMGTSGTYVFSYPIPATGTKYFCLIGHKSTGIVADIVGVWYKIIDTTTTAITGGFYYKSNLSLKDGITLDTLPLRGSSTILGGVVYGVAKVTEDHILGNHITDVIMKLPSPTATTVDTSAGSWGGRTGTFPWNVSPGDTGQQYGGFASIIQDPTGIRVYSYVSGGIVAANGGNFNGITTSGILTTVFDGSLVSSGVNDASADFGMPFSDDGKNFAGAAGTSRDYNVSPSIVVSQDQIIFARTFSDSHMLARVRRFLFDTSTGGITSLGLFDTDYTAVASAGDPEWVQSYLDGTIIIFAGRDTHRLLLGQYNLTTPLIGNNRRWLDLIGPVRVMA